MGFKTILILMIFVAGDLAATIPFERSLQQAKIEVELKNQFIEEYSLLVGNGDLNGLVFGDNGSLKLRLTKNDVWDARLPVEKDNSLPTMERLEEMVLEEGWPPPHPQSGWWNQRIVPKGEPMKAYSYDLYPYPCPVSCGQIRIGEPQRKSWWRNIRELDTAATSWETLVNRTTMSLSGEPQASAGYATNQLEFNTSEYPRLKVVATGSPNAKYFIELFQGGRHSIYSSGWIEAPDSLNENTFVLPSDKTINTVYVYAMTVDGKTAEVSFESVKFESADGDKKLELDLYASPSKNTNTNPEGQIHLQRAVVDASGGSLTDSVEIRALADRNVMLLITEEEIHLEPGGQTFLPAAETGSQANLQWLLQEIPGDVDWPGMHYAVAAIQDNGRAVVAVVTSLEVDDPKAAAIRLARETLQENTSELIEKHEAVWNNYWSRSGVQLEEPVFEQLWYRQLYFLRCVLKPGVQSPALYYSLTTDTPMWHGDYHLNYNLQSTYWSTLSCNHPEMMEPYNRLMREYLPRAEWLAETIYGIEGAFYPHILYAYETDPATSQAHNKRQFIHHVWGLTLGLGAFGVQPMWQQYKYWPDEQRLRDEIWPVLFETALFYANFMESCERDANGKVRLGPTISPEIHAWTKDFERNYNCAFDISQITYLFEAFIEASDTLGEGQSLAARCQELLEVMPPYPVDPDQNVVVDVVNSPVGTAQNIPGPYTPVFPGDVVNWWSSPEEKDIFARTIPTVFAPGQGNSYIMGPVARARLGMPDAYDFTLQSLGERVSPNGTMGLNPWHEVDREKRYMNSFGMYAEVAAASMAINELMLQSVGDIIRIFPAWDSNKDAAFKTLRTQGGFLVSASFKDGTVEPFTIRSTAGGTLRVLSPWPQAKVTIGNRSQQLTPDERGLVTLDTQTGMDLQFSPGE